MKLPELPKLSQLKMTPQVRRWIGWIGYPAFYLFALVLFSYLTAPYDRLRYALIAGFNSGDAPVRLELDELSWSWRFPGVSGSDGRFVGKKTASAEPGAKDEAIEYPIDDFYVSLSVLPLLIGTTSASFGLDAFGGQIEGSVSDGSDEQSFEVELEELDVAQLPYLRDMVGLPMQGMVVGAIDLTLPEGQFSQAEGSLKLDIESLAIGDGEAKIRGTIALPRIDAGLFTLDATVEEGQVDIAEFSSRGTDLELVADGKIRLLDKPENSLVEMNLRFKFTDKYKTQSDVTKALFGAPNSKVPGVFDLDPKIKQAKRDDGFYAWRLTGPLSKLNFQPATGTAAARAGTEKAPTKKRQRVRKRPRLRNFAAGRSRREKAAARAPTVTPRPTPPRPPTLGAPPQPTPQPEEVEEEEFEEEDVEEGQDEEVVEEGVEEEPAEGEEGEEGEEAEQGEEGEAPAEGEEVAE